MAEEAVTSDSRVGRSQLLPTANGQAISRQANGRLLSPARVEALLMMVGAGAILAAARLLTPDPSGYGTHEHIFLLPCVFRSVTGLPCPFCGMTTAFALMARGQWAAAFGIHALSPAAYLLTWGVMLAGAVGLVRNRRAVPQWLFGQRAGRVILFIILLGWVANLARVLWHV